MKYRISHNTTYQYGTSAELCHNVLRLTPRTIQPNTSSLASQICLATRLTIDPTPASLHTYEDYFGNRVHSFAIYQPHQALSITAESEVTVEPHSELDLSATMSWPGMAEWLRGNASPMGVAALDYVFDSPYIAISESLGRFALPHFHADRSIGESALALTQHIHREFHYDPQATTIDTSVEDVLERRRGVCQDFAHLAIACLRSLGLACRYVSGYLRTDPSPGMSRLVGADASHAWISVFCARFGWIDFDPTNGCVASDRHITLGWGRDFHDVSPVKGSVLGGGDATLRVAVDVQLLDGGE